MKTLNIPEPGKIISIVYIAGAFIALVLVYKILAGVGIIKTAKRRERSGAESELRQSDYFNPLFLSGRTGGYASLGSAAKDTARLLRQAVRGAGTNEEKIFSAFGRLPSRWSISEVALSYKSLYNRDLLSDLLNDLNDREQLTLWDIIKKLPEK